MYVRVPGLEPENRPGEVRFISDRRSPSGGLLRYEAEEEDVAGLSNAVK